MKILVGQKNWTEAKKLLELFFRDNLLDQQEGEAMLNISSAYLEAMNSLNRQHIEVLDNTLDMLKSLDKEQRKEEEGIDLKLARHQISKN